MELRSQLQQVALEWPAYGYRRITAELQRRSFEVNHKHVLRLMREDNLLCLRRRSFLVTTDSGHNLPVYPNLARQMRPVAINQLWIADITYIRLRAEFVYLAVVLDAFSRRVIGWLWVGRWRRSWRFPRCAWRSSSGNQQRDWCITPIVACSTLRASTPVCCNNTWCKSA